MTEDRLSRIETKLDQMAEAIVSLARMEERMVTLFKRMDNYDTSQNDISARLHKLERSVGSNGQTLRFAERLFWITASAAVAYMFAGGNV
jgi:septation ring formation regulator EzrA